MRKILLLLTFLAILPTSAYATDKIYSSSELIDLVSKNTSMDGRFVVLEGEIISEPIERRDGCWVNVTDGNMAIGVFFKDCNQTKSVKIWGQHLFKGDTVRIEGKVYSADKLTDGELDIQGETLVVVEPGHPITIPIPFWKIILAIFLSATALYLAYERLVGNMKSRKSRNRNILTCIIDSDSSSRF